jgi:hypothetical protein
MSSREKNQSDFDLETFVDLFDTAISSNNPAVKTALKNLLLIATMVQSELTPEQRVAGPLRQVIDDIRNLNRRLSNLEDNRIYPQTPSIAYPNIVSPSINTPWPNINPNVVPSNWPPGSITCSSGIYTDTVKSEDC